jgi:hypothetical protein
MHVRLTPAIWLLLAVSTTAKAAHPLITEDTGTQGVGNAELQFGFSWTRDGGDRAFSFQPQLSYGVLTTVDLIVQPQWLTVRTLGSDSSRGFGDTVMDAKWRFYGDTPLSFAVRAGATFPTGEGDLSQLNGKPSAHALLVTNVDLAPLTIDGNVGYIRNRSAPGLRTDLYHASAAAVFAANDELSLVADTAFDSNPDPLRPNWPGVLLVGAIYTLRPGLDIDFGYQTRLNHAAPAQQLLLGITYRWAP